MTETEDKLRDYLKRVTAELRAVKQEAERSERDATEPIAIVGMACRFPGGIRGPEALWDMLDTGRDVVGTFPTDRGWDLDTLVDPTGERPGTSTVDRGSFLDDVAFFDCGFFGISPREALSMDPQQRILLESVWEAMENGGIDPTALHESDTGVFLGATDHDYGTDLTGIPTEIEGNAMIGRSGAVSAGRISYTLGLNGPALTIDTMCSSSLVALHLACQSLRRNECTLAVTGGTTVLSTPEGYTEFSRQGALASDGRCKSFSDDADGTGWAEGVGVLVVERLSSAIATGHDVLAVVRGSAINQDGASNGLTAPSVRAQRAVIAAALADAGLTGKDIDMVEAHGTGTTLGDPIEAQSIIATYGRGRTAEDPIRLGSMKSNIGHAAAAAGVGGVIKTVLSLQHGRMPKTLHVGTPTTRVDWSAGTVALLTEPMEWPEHDRPRRGAVSAFGASGTNAHVILEQAPVGVEIPEPAAPQPSLGDGSILQWRISARSDDAVVRQADALLSLLEDRPEQDVADIAYSLATRRAELGSRAVVIGADRLELVSGLRSIVRSTESDAVVLGSGTGRAETVFVFPGQGSQWPAMAVELAAQSPVFAAGLTRCGAALDPYLDVSLDEILFGERASELQDRVDLVQPALWAMMVALADVWISAGVTPAAVVGHSQGEIAAACVAGALTIEDGAAVVALRSRALLDLAEGGMLAVSLSRSDAESLVAESGLEISIAAVNGPRSVVLSGDRDGLDVIGVQLENAGTRARTVPVTYASHSAHVDAVHERLLRDLASIAPTTGTVPLYSSLTTEQLDTGTMDAEYWFQNLRGTVEFDRTVRAMIDDGFATFVEISAHPVLVSPLTEIFDSVPSGGSCLATSTLRREDGGLRRLSTAFAEYFVAGGSLDWRALVAGKPTMLPVYAFDRTRYWLTGTGPKVRRYDEAPALTGAEADDSAFWDLVSRGDIADFTSALGVDADADAATVLAALDSWRRGGEQAAAAERLRFCVEWQALPARPPGSRTGLWTLLVPRGLEAGADGLSAAFARVGIETRTLSLDVDTVDRRGIADVLLADSVERSGGSGVGGIVSLLADATGERADFPDVPLALGVSTLLLQAVSDGGAGAPVWIVTRESESVGPQDGPPDPVQGAVAALVRVAVLEMPTRVAGTIDLPALSSPDSNRSAVAAVVDNSPTGDRSPGAPQREDQLAVRASGLFGRRLVRAESAVGVGKPQWKSGETALITGGTGGIGRQLALWVAEHGARTIVLVSRRGADATGSGDLVAELSARGVRAEIVAADVGDAGSMTELRDRHQTDGHPITTVFHIAGAGTLAALADTTAEEFAATTRAKVVGARVLDEVYAGPEVADFVLFSSISAVWGSGAHGAYASANAYLDTLSMRRRRLGHPAVSIVWGIWDPSETGGMAAALSEETLRARGIPFMDPAGALVALDRVLGTSNRPVEVISEVDWETFLPVFTAARPSPLLSALSAEFTVGDGGNSSEAAPLIDVLGGQDADQRVRTVLALVRTAVAEALALPEGTKIDSGTAFRDLGMDSLTAVDVRKRLSASTGMRLPVTMVFDHPNAKALSEFVLDEILPPVEMAEDAVAVPSGSVVERNDEESFDDMDIDALVRSALGNSAEA